MRPTKLVMSAFGPYADVCDIDFDALGTSGVYLVCGDTGAGKTMIFDAICYALFGEASGDVKGGARAVSSLRSDYAESTANTYVELWFDYRGKPYRIKRNPAYERVKTRGAGTTEQKARAELEFPDGRIINQPRVVNNEVKKLLGIDVGQFKQIVMLAQGEFRKLLTADTETRALIFRKLFGTEMYESIQERLAEESRKLERDADKLNDQIKGFALAAQFEPGSGTEIELKEKQSSQVPFGEWLKDALEEQLAADEPQHEELLKTVDALRRTWAETNTLLKRVENRAHYEAERKRLLDELARKQEETAQLRVAFEAQLTQDAARNAATERAVYIEGMLPKYAELERAEHELKARMAAREDARVSLAQAQQAAEASAQKLGDYTLAMAELVGADLALERAKVALDTAERDAEAARTARDAALELRDKESVAARAGTALVNAQASRDEAARGEDDAALALASTQKVLLEFGGAPAELASAQAEHKEASSRLVNAQALVKERERLARGIEESREPYNDALKRYQTAESEHTAALVLLNNLQKRQREGRAGILAADLIEGQPCPVCGSTHHPKPATSGVTIPSDEEIDEAAADEAASVVELAEATGLAENRKAVLEEKQSHLADFDRKHGGAQGVEGALVQAQSALSEAEARLSAAEARLAEHERAQHDADVAKTLHERAALRLKEAEVACQKAHEEYIAAQASLETLRASGGVLGVEEADKACSAAEKGLVEARSAADVAQAKADKLLTTQAALDAAQAAQMEAAACLDSAKAAFEMVSGEYRLIEGKVEHIKADLEFGGKDEAETEALRLRTLAAELLAKRTAAETALRNNESAIGTCKTSLENYERYLADIPSIDIEATTKERDAVEAKGKQLGSEANNLMVRIEANRSCLRSLENTLVKQADIEGRYGRVKQLADVATGNLSGQTKIRFEAYVQAIYFDKVIDAANARLKALTSGQFELIRYSEGDGRSKAGLGLYVIDSFTGRTRDASSLSGGESFQASLCLALGLSDVVQAHAGGIEFDTMFVDEGFGSLDQGALGNAISLLSDLSGGTKLVGIISHVEDLKANIPKKIVVTKDRGGSRVSMEL